MSSRLSRLAAVACLFFPVAAAADRIELRSNEWCPFVCDPAGGHPGYMVEIAREALALHGHEVNFELLTWQRALDYGESGRIDGVVGTDEYEAPDFVFGDPIAIYQEAAAFRTGEAVEYADLASRDDLRLGASAAYDYSEEVSDFMERFDGDTSHVQMLSGESALPQNLMKLAASRVDFVPEERSVLSYTIDQLGLEDRFEVTLDPDIYPVYVAFSPALQSSQRYAEQLSDGYRQLQASGRVAEILASYGLEELTD